VLRRYILPSLLGVRVRMGKGCLLGT
jgi:hypothetical protein